MLKLKLPKEVDFTGRGKSSVEGNLERIMNEPDKPKGDKGDGGGGDSEPANIENYLALPDVKSYGADDKAFREYGTVYAAKDVVKENSNVVRKTAYQAIEHFEKQGDVDVEGEKFMQRLPDFALSSYILVQAFKKGVQEIVDADGKVTGYKTLNKDWRAVLDQYKDCGLGWGWHAQNSLIHGGKVIHNPNDEDFPEHGGNSNVNHGQRLELDFAPDYDNMTLDDALNNPQALKDLKNLTGLKEEDLKILPKIAEYYGRTARFWITQNTDRTCSAWLGCNSSDSFCINANDYLSDYSACRGVLLAPKALDAKK